MQADVAITPGAALPRTMRPTSEGPEDKPSTIAKASLEGMITRLDDKGIMSRMA